MIERYSRKEIKNIWEDKNKYSIWLDIELSSPMPPKLAEENIPVSNVHNIPPIPCTGKTSSESSILRTFLIYCVAS